MTSLQQQLNQNGTKLETDGDFGAGTEEAVKQFQKSNNLGADGLVGPSTWRALKDQGSGKTGSRSVGAGGSSKGAPVRAGPGTKLSRR